MLSSEHRRSFSTTDVWNIFHLRGFGQVFIHRWSLSLRGCGSFWVVVLKCVHIPIWGTLEQVFIHRLSLSHIPICFLPKAFILQTSLSYWLNHPRLFWLISGCALVGLASQRSDIIKEIATKCSEKQRTHKQQEDKEVELLARGHWPM